MLGLPRGRFSVLTQGARGRKGLANGLRPMPLVCRGPSVALVLPGWWPGSKSSQDPTARAGTWHQALQPGQEAEVSTGHAVPQPRGCTPAAGTSLPCPPE